MCDNPGDSGEVCCGRTTLSDELDEWSKFPS